MKIRRNFNLNKIKLDLSKVLNTGIKIISSDIQQGIERGSQFGRAFVPNAPSTVKKKGFNHPLKHTGLMMNAGKMIKGKATRNKQTATLSPHERRIDIAFWNDQGTDNIPARPFWGISEKAEKNILKMAEQEIETELKRA